MWSWWRASTLKSDIGGHSFSFVKIIPQWHGSINSLYGGHSGLFSIFSIMKSQLKKGVCACMCEGAYMNMHVILCVYTLFLKNGSNSYCWWVYLVNLTNIIIFIIIWQFLFMVFFCNGLHMWHWFHVNSEGEQMGRFSEQLSGKIMFPEARATIVKDQSWRHCCLSRERTEGTLYQLTRMLAHPCQWSREHSPGV